MQLPEDGLREDLVKLLDHLLEEDHPGRRIPAAIRRATGLSYYRLDRARSFALGAGWTTEEPVGPRAVVLEITDAGREAWPELRGG